MRDDKGLKDLKYQDPKVLEDNITKQCIKLLGYPNLGTSKQKDLKVPFTVYKD